MFCSVSSPHRLTQISRHLHRTLEQFSTMPLIAQNPNDRIILGLMTFGSRTSSTCPTRAPAKLSQVLMHPLELASQTTANSRSISITFNRKATMRSTQLACM